ncbi:MAG: DNA polymerase III subunit gamma/tau [Phycisphaerae bacterium]
MAYTVLARRYRSRNFDELVGQEAIATTLKNAITAGRVAHAYLFTGTRGVGKTSTARILAKALNCEKGPTPDPDSTCSICQDIARGEDVDVIEIDGASNTSVEDVRQLRNNAIYRPARGRFKIYIIDEVHMISTSAFNALLKTLEEPPEHVKFIFATTEPNKVPITIQSRCQRFDFKPISKAKIAEQIRLILAEEKIEADTAVVDRVARLANGSMRDALSLLDQLLSVGQKKLTSELADQFLPVPPVELYAQLVDSILTQDAAGVLRQADTILAAGTSPGDFCSALAEYLRDLMVASSCKDGQDLLFSPETAHPKLMEQGGQLKPLTWAYAITVIEELSRSVKFSEQSRTLIDAAMVTLAYISDLTDINQTSSTSTETASEPSKKKVPTIPEPVTPKRHDREGVVEELPASSTNKSVSPHHAAMAEPIVRKVLDLFEGRLVEVKPVAKK